MGAIDRRRFLSGTAAALGATLGAGLLGGCGGSVLGKEGSVRFWNLFTGGDGDRMIEMENRFRKQNPSITLEAVTLSWGAPYYTKLAMAAAGGRAPEVGILHLSRLTGFAPGKLLDPFDLDLLKEFDVEPSSFPDVLAKRATVDGKLYAVPLDTHQIVLYINRDLVRKAGLLAGPDELAPIGSPDKFLAALDRIQKATGMLPLATGNDPSTWWRYLWTFYRQYGGTLALPVGETVQYDRDKMREVLEFMRKVWNGKRAKPTMDLGGASGAFTEGKAPLMLNGNWELPTMTTAQKEQKGKPDFTMIQMPAVFGESRVAWADSHSLVLPHQRSRDPERDRLAYKLIATLLKESTVWAEGGHVPAYLPVQDGPDFAKAKPASNYRQAAEVAQLDPEAWFTGGGSEFQNQVGAVVDSTLRGSLTVDAGLKQFESAMNKLLRIPSPV